MRFFQHIDARRVTLVVLGVLLVTVVLQRVVGGAKTTANLFSTNCQTDQDCPTYSGTATCVNGACSCTTPTCIVNECGQANAECGALQVPCSDTDINNPQAPTATCPGQSNYCVENKNCMMPRQVSCCGVMECVPDYNLLTEQPHSRCKPLKYSENCVTGKCIANLSGQYINKADCELDIITGALCGGAFLSSSSPSACTPAGLTGCVNGSGITTTGQQIACCGGGVPILGTDSCQIIALPVYEGAGHVYTCPPQAIRCCTGDGVCGAVADPTCKGQNQNCNPGECCSQLTCTPLTIGANPQCLPNCATIPSYASCLNNCYTTQINPPISCESQCSWDNHCAPFFCKQANEPCTANGDCCAGLACNTSGKCENIPVPPAPTSCLGEGKQFCGQQADQECCSGLNKVEVASPASCTSPNKQYKCEQAAIVPLPEPNPQPSLCKGLDSSCQSTAECCDGLSCNNLGKCIQGSCIPIGQTYCTSEPLIDGKCCFGLSKVPDSAICLPSSNVRFSCLGQ